MPRDRIKSLRRVRASDLRPSPHNWRTHPPRQREILAGVLAELGYADALLARELPDGALELIDGHLRAETTPDAEVPVLVLDLSADEAAKLLAVLDPLAAMAEPDRSALAELIAGVDTEEPALRSFLDELLSNNPSPPPPSSDEPPRAVDISETFQVLVDCRDEQDQQTLYNRLTADGYPCRLLTL